jgi:carboxypeptidase C (cathepsin A)
LTRNNRWASPKYLIGESYGTTRVSGLALELQESQWMYFNGVILVSPTNLGLVRSAPQTAALRLPYFAATAWYHKKLPADLQQKDLSSCCPSGKLTMNELPAINREQFPDAEKKARLKWRYSGIDAEVYLQNNLDVSTASYGKNCCRMKGTLWGRLDPATRVDLKDAGERPDYNSNLRAGSTHLLPINMYIREKLNYK